MSPQQLRILAAATLALAFLIAWTRQAGAESVRRAGRGSATRATRWPRISAAEARPLTSVASAVTQRPSSAK